jgi:hypothetical protein
MNAECVGQLLGASLTDIRQMGTDKWGQIYFLGASIAELSMD